MQKSKILSGLASLVLCAGCSVNDKPEPKSTIPLVTEITIIKKAEKPKYEGRLVADVDLKKFKRFYDNIDLSHLSDDEIAILLFADRKKVKQRIYQDFGTEILEKMKGIWDVDNIGEKEIIAYYRFLESIGPWVKSYDMQKLEKEKNLAPDARK